MLPDKIIKKQFKDEASKHPNKFYATSVLKREDFVRNQCECCGLHFWNTDPNRKVCGDAACSGGFSLFDNNPSKVQLSYVDVWKEFRKRFSKSGYTAIDRFPVIARWNPTADFTMASIAAFQPFVISGEAKPPAEKLVIPQFCLRFGDVDNVGITMSHMTGFVMIGQHQFVKPITWEQNKAFEELYKWFTEGLGLEKEELTFHEDAWAGGGNFGPCMEIFSRGVELANQVYMLYEQDDMLPSGRRSLQLKVLDMGMGMERNAWFSQASPTIYDATFPFVISKLKEATGIVSDDEFLRTYGPYGAFLNLDEVEDIKEAWTDVAKKMGVSMDELRTKLHPMTALYSVAEHARSLLFAIADGGLPSNVGGGYNLRVILRRALSFIEEYNWKVELIDVCKWHAQELQEIFPELLDSIDTVKTILEVEKRKFIEGRKRNKQMIVNELKKGIPSVDRLIELYDSQGITPEEFKKQNKDVEVPDNFYMLVAAKHEQEEQENQTKKKTIIPIEAPKTKILYYGDWSTTTFSAEVLQIIPKDEEYSYVILDQTAFYPTSGGQIHDLGFIDGCDVVDCIKQGGHILHVVRQVNFYEGNIIQGIIDVPRRQQLTQHHTATHIINGAAKEVLGKHIWQAGAAKTLEKGRLDITHYDTLSNDELKKIEDVANRVVNEDITVHKSVVPRDVAEKTHGFTLYQGGAVPGGEIRIVEIPSFDTEACGGTHVNSTGEVGKIKIVKSSKVQDGTIRIEFKAGEAAEAASGEQEDLLSEAAELLGCSIEQIPSRAEELFTKWKKAKKKKLDAADFDLTSEESFDGDVLSKTAEILKTQPEHIVKTIKKFADQLVEFKAKL